MRTPKQRKKRKPGQALEPAALPTLKERLQIWAWIVGIFLFLATTFHFLTTREHQADLDVEVRRWRAAYHLNDEQARRVREIEDRFHGSGDPFTTPSHTPAEIREHHRAVAAVMNPEDGARFFRDEEGIDLSPSPP